MQRKDAGRLERKPASHVDAAINKKLWSKHAQSYPAAVRSSLAGRIFGDSQVIIAAQNGFATIRQTKLQPLAVRVNQIITNFAWTSWKHTKREQKKMVDLLANMAMNSKNAKILTDESWGNDQVVMSQVAALLDNDIGATPSKTRNTSLSAVSMRLRNSQTAE
ncbi:hypothetical protein FI667_g9353, partial [Globisporangium splendens]